MASIRNRVVAVAGAGLLALAGTLLPSQSGLNAIKQHEGVRYGAYLDAVQVPTICYGSTRRVHIGQRATPDECAQRLKEDAGIAGAGVAKNVRVPITQTQYDALVSFVFNVGEPKFRNSTMLRKINAGDCYGAGREFDRWVYAGGKPLRGLVQRRADERGQWDAGCVAW